MIRFLGKSSGYLFSSFDLSENLRTRISALHSEVEEIEANRFLNTSPADLTSYLVEKYKADAPVLRRSEAQVSYQECKVDVRHDFRRDVRDKTRPALVAGQRIEIEVPFHGDSELFYARPDTLTLSPPRASLRGSVVVWTYEIPHDDEVDLRPQIDRTLNEVERYLSNIRRQVERHNSSLEQVAVAAIEQRRQRLLKYYARVADLGLPIKQRSDAPQQTYVLPNVRKKVLPALPYAPSCPYVPEPTLDMKIYEHILSVIQNMARVMECSPRTFSKLNEEELRQHFLVQLNGQFEGDATGETFNVSGKTDILLRHAGRNVFIAECKFWRGPKYYRQAIDQLLSYSSWRDTKTAILMFNRSTNLTKVLETVRRETMNHPNFTRQVEWSHETGFRFVLHHNGDRNRELILTVLVFDVPRPITDFDLEEQERLKAQGKKDSD